jgi:hypothetical protein
MGLEKLEQWIEVGLKEFGWGLVFGDGGGGGGLHGESGRAGEGELSAGGGGACVNEGRR